jgi:hypothetical protein
MSNVKSRILVLACMLAATLALGFTATAAAPEITKFSFSDSYVDTLTCPAIPIQTELTGRITIKEFGETRVQVHQNLVYRGTANGKIFTDNESFTMFANPQTGVQKFAGTVLNIQIPGHGNVLKDAGVLVADFSTNPPAVLHEGGKHPLFHDGFGALCDYLAS